MVFIVGLFLLVCVLIDCFQLRAQKKCISLFSTQEPDAINCGCSTASPCGVVPVFEFSVLLGYAQRCLSDFWGTTGVWGLELAWLIALRGFGVGSFNCAEGVWSWLGLLITGDVLLQGVMGQGSD